MKTLMTTACLIPCLLLGFVSSSAAEDVKVEVTISVPDPGWGLRVISMHEKKGRLLVVCEAKHNGGINAQVISKAKASAEIDAKYTKLPRDVFLLGRRWNWGEGYTAVSPQELKKIIKGSKQVYQAKVDKVPEAKDFIGLELKKAEALADKHKLAHRVVMIDGKPRPATLDFRPNRLNFTVEKGQVTKVTKG